MTWNVLLMLSGNQEPNPQKEVHALREDQRAGNPVFLGTSYGVHEWNDQLTPGESLVVLYADAQANNRVLAFGRFVSVQDEPFHVNAIYNGLQYPAFVQLEGFLLARQPESLASLGGTIVASGRPLELPNLPGGHANARVYFTTANPIDLEVQEEEWRNSDEGRSAFQALGLGQNASYQEAWNNRNANYPAFQRIRANVFRR